MGGGGGGRGGEMRLCNLERESVKKNSGPAFNKINLGNFFLPAIVHLPT